MKTSDSIANIAPAFLVAQKNIGAAVKDQKNPFFKSTYADLGSVMEACKEALNKNGIAVLQPVGMEGEKTYVETILLHESGEYISDRMIVLLEKATPQGQGSAITYARRYALQSMCFIPAEDDDGNRAEAQKTNQSNGHSASQSSKSRLVSSQKLNDLYARGKKAQLFASKDDFVDYIRDCLELDAPIEPKLLTEEQARDVEAMIFSRERQSA